MRRAEPVAGLGGILLLASLFLPWYEFVPPAPKPAETGVLGLLHGYIGDVRPTAWQSFAVIDVLLALLALLAIAVPVVSVLAKGPAKPVATAVLASALGWIAILLAAFRLLDAPLDNVEPRVGAWLALAGAVVAWAGSWLSLRDESTPGAVAPDLPRRPAPPTAAA
jgi:hypothetical protein